MPTSNIRVGGGTPSVAIDTQGSTLISESGSTISVTLTVANQSNRALVALVGNNNTKTISGIAYTAGSGGSWAQLGTIANGQFMYEIWTSVAPSTGSITVQATLSSAIGGGSDACLQLYSLYNVDQTTAADNYASAAATETLGVTSAATNMALCSLQSSSNADPLDGGGTNDLSNANNAFWRAGHFQTGPTATFSWQSGFGGRAINGCNVRKA